ncbi:MAG: hypothetical protein ACU0CA_09445 [Paracoccaceae bacterium]
MQDDKRPHHLTELVLLHVEAYETHCVSRPPLPMRQMYPMDKVQDRLHVKPPKVEKTEDERKSMFFRNSDHKLDKDPFLQRLSRLH